MHVKLCSLGMLISPVFMFDHGAKYGVSMYAPTPFFHFDSSHWQETAKVKLGKLLGRGTFGHVFTLRFKDSKGSFDHQVAKLIRLKPEDTEKQTRIVSAEAPCFFNVFLLAIPNGSINVFLAYTIYSYLKVVSYIYIYTWELRSFRFM